MGCGQVDWLLPVESPELALETDQSVVRCPVGLFDRFVFSLASLTIASKIISGPVL